MLTKPFFNTIPAFSAVSATNLQLQVLGGDAITSFTYTIYNNATNAQVATATINVSSDMSSESIRSFAFTLAAGTLTQNTTYNIIAYTQNDFYQSPNSTPQIFTCYVTPTLSVTINNAASNIISANFANISAAFNIVDASSPAKFQSVKYTLVGNLASGATSLIGESDTIYSLTDSVDIKGLVPTIDAQGQPIAGALYTSYTLSWVAYTTDQTQITGNITSIQCYYELSTNSNVFIAQNNSSVGNIKLIYNYNGDSVLSKVVFSRTNPTTGETFTIATYINTASDDFLRLTIFDNLAANNTLYEYAATSYINNTINDALISQVNSQFCKNYICDTNTIYDITPEFDIGAVDTIQKVAVYEPYGSVYPFVGYNASTKYRTGSTTAILLTSTTASSANIDRLGQVKSTQIFNDWLTNKRAKVLKDINGNIAIVAVISGVSNKYYKQLGNGIASTTISWAEISDFTEKNMAKLALTNNAQILVANPTLAQLLVSGELEVLKTSYLANLTALKKYALAGCTGLKTATIPSNFTDINKYAFAECTNLSSATFDDTTTWYYTTQDYHTAGTQIDVTNPATNATNLSTTYVDKLWYKT